MIFDLRLTTYLLISIYLHCKQSRVCSTNEAEGICVFFVTDLYDFKILLKSERQFDFFFYFLFSGTLRNSFGKSLLINMP